MDKEIELDWLSDAESLFVKIVDQFSDETGAGDKLYESRSRTGIFAPALVMWLMISEKSQGRRSLSEALSSLSAGDGELIRSRNKKSDTKEFSQNTGGLCRARERLSLEKVKQFTRYLSHYLIEGSSEEFRWRGQMVVLVDGTTMTLHHTQEILNEYRPIKNQHRRVHNPQLLCLCAHELFTGMALAPQFGPYRGDKATSELKLYHQMVKDLPPKSLIMADRYFGNFSVMHHAHTEGHQVLIRLTQRQAQSLVRKRDKDYTEDVLWTPSKQILKKYSDISPSDVVKGRVIRHTVEREGFRPLVLYFFTSSKEPHLDLVELYLQRERIENDIRSLKYLMGLEIISGKSPDSIAKELFLTFASANLMHAILAKASSILQINPRQISFKRAADLTRVYGNKIRNSSSPEQRQETLRQYIVAISQVKHPNRKKRRVEPRKCVRHKGKFPLMKKSRELERADALKSAKRFGHRGFTYPAERI